MDRDQLLGKYRATRALSVELCCPLRPEDYRVQSMPDVSPPWWNLGHTTWFFARNVLAPFGRYREEDARLEYVLNSYYESLGPRIARVTTTHSRLVQALRTAAIRWLPERLIASAAAARPRDPHAALRAAGPAGTLNRDSHG